MKSRVILLATSFAAACAFAPTAAPSPPFEPAQANCERSGGTFELDPTAYFCLLEGAGASLTPNEVKPARELCEHLYGGVFGQSPATGNYACDLPLVQNSD
jgi:hypothetical protein